MAKIIGNTTATPNPRPDWAQTDSTKADYIKNKPEVYFGETDGEEVAYNGECEDIVKEISFAIQTHDAVFYFKAKEGMRWYEWVESEYNTNHILQMGNGSYPMIEFENGDQLMDYRTEIYQNPLTLIQDGGAYAED